MPFTGCRGVTAAVSAGEGTVLTGMVVLQMIVKDVVVVKI
jgi:hypothetical protein